MSAQSRRQNHDPGRNCPIDGANACTASAVTSPTPGIVVSPPQLLVLPDQQPHLLVDLVDLRVQLVDPLKQHRRRRDHQLRKRLGVLSERLPQLLEIGNASRRDQTELLRGDRGSR